MTQYNTLNGKLSSCQLNKSKLEIKDGTEVTENFIKSCWWNKKALHKIRKSGEFLGRILGRLLKNGLPLIENLLKPLAKSLLISLGSTAATSGTDPAIHKKNFGLRTRPRMLGKWA